MEKFFAGIFTNLSEDSSTPHLAKPMLAEVIFYASYSDYINWSKYLQKLGFPFR